MLLCYSVELDAIALYMTEYSKIWPSVAQSVSSGFIYTEHVDCFMLTFGKKRTLNINLFLSNKNRGCLHSFNGTAAILLTCRLWDVRNSWVGLNIPPLLCSDSVSTLLSVSDEIRIFVFRHDHPICTGCSRNDEGSSMFAGHVPFQHRKMRNDIPSSRPQNNHKSQSRQFISAKMPTDCFVRSGSSAAPVSLYIWWGCHASDCESLKRHSEIWYEQADLDAFADFNHISTHLHLWFWLAKNGILCFISVVVQSS